MKYKFTFKKLNKKETLVLDNNYSGLNVSDYNLGIFDNKEINLFYFFKTIFNYFFKYKKTSLSHAYLRTIISEIAPKILIDNHNSKRGYVIKKYFPETKLIIYQFGNIFPTFYDHIIPMHQKKNSDYFLVWNKKTKSRLKKFNSKVLVTGSLKNNERKILKREKKYDIMFISEFRSLFNDRAIKNLDSEEKYKYYLTDYADKAFQNVYMSYVLRLLNKYVSLNQKKLCIAQSSTRKDKKNKISQNDEKLFNCTFAPNHFTENVDSETLAEKSKMIVCLTSTLGPELASKGHKVFFLNLTNFMHNWEFKARQNSIFFHNGTEEKEIFAKINKMLKMSNKSWKKLIKSNFDLLIYDEENRKLKNLIKKILN